MCSSLPSFPFCLLPPSPFLSHHRLNFRFSGNPLYVRPRNPSRLSLSASIGEKNSSLEVSWISWDKAASDEYNGWYIAEAAPEPIKKKGLRTFAVIGIGASVAAVIGLFAYFSFSSKGFVFRIRSSFNALHGFSVPSSTIKDGVDSEEVSDDLSLEDSQLPRENLSDVTDVSDAFVATDASFDTMKEQKLERIIVPFAVDSAQQEALLALKKLKIIEDDARADELCTRREYARWLVRANSQLERSRKHRINSSVALSGSRITAFDDVGVEDPDFESIQSLAEAGIVRSKLSDENSGSNPYSVGDGGHVYFSPERFISRQDLVSWKVKIEYEVTPGINKEMSRKNIGFLDVKEVSSDAMMELFMDILADEKSIIRGVFGQSKRLQPNKPCTKAQAAVALTSGRMVEFIQEELSRLEAENISRQNELKEVMSELLERGDIKQYWERKMEEERIRGFEVQIDYHSAISALEQEKTKQKNSLAELVKQKAALDCQKQLLSSLKAEVTEMSEKLSFEKAKYIDEYRSVQDMKHDLQVKFEGLVDSKSIMEAELEALRILRSWIEDEARKSQARAKVLEEAGRRWKWDS